MLFPKARKTMVTPKPKTILCGVVESDKPSYGKRHMKPELDMDL
jgi:hypothetical protein